MTGSASVKDLVILSADADIEFALRGLLTRAATLGIRPISVEYYRHMHHDPGCLRDSHEFLRSSLRSHAQALVVFDRDGCGREDLTRDQIEALVEKRLAQNGWEQRAAAIVIDPELERWVWADSSEVDRVLGWSGHTPGLRQWLRQEGHLGPSQLKPGRPKEALRAALRSVGKPPSSSLFEQLALCLPLNQCQDPAFAKLVGVLRSWFDETHAGTLQP
jgi:hypothetical protein